MNTTEIEKLAALPLVQDAIRAQAEAAEGESLKARLAVLDAYQQASDELTTLDKQQAELDAMQYELERQRDELAKQQAAHLMARQQVETRRRTHARELREKQGSELAVTIGRMLGIHAQTLRREVEYQRSLREKKLTWMGEAIEKPSPEAMRKADELERRAEQIERDRDAILALEYAHASPMAIERDIRARVGALGLTLNTTTGQAGWRVDGWNAKPKTKAA